MNTEKTDSTLITCSNVTFAYENSVVASNLNFEVHTKDYLCIVGENGSGKSTLIKGLLGLKEPETGSITLGGGLRRNEIGYLPQQTAAQKDFPASVYEVVLSGRLNSRGWKPFYAKEDKTLALQNMERLGILDIQNQCYRDLSGGQQQRVLLARALCATKKMLLLDEPVSGLDPVVTAEMYKLISMLNDTDGITIIMVSHDVRTALMYCNQILHLNNEQAFFGSKEDYLKDEVCKNFLGTN